MHSADLGSGIEYEQDIMAIGTDSVLLADFALPAAGNVCDLGCGAGAVMLLMALKGGANAVFTGVELRESAAAKAERNIAGAGLSSRMRVLHGDLREICGELNGGEYDTVVSNPPYMPVGASLPPENAEAEIARTEKHCTMDDICRVSARLLRYGGRLCVVYPPERLADLCVTMRKHKIEPKRMRLYHRNINAPPSLLLMEGRNGGREGLKIMPPLIGGSPEFTDISRTF